MGPRSAGSCELVFFRQKPPEFRLIDQVVRMLFVREKIEGKTARGGHHIRSFLDGHVGLAEDAHDEVHDQLEPPDFAVFFQDFRFADHTFLRGRAVKTNDPQGEKFIIS